MRPIDADALKDKLQQHHDFYVMAWGGFGKMPIGEKKRVDEITNCIAEVVNAPTIEPKQGEWIEHKHGFWTFVNDKGERDGWIPDYECNLCGARAFKFKTLFCPTCGAHMKGADDE